MYVAISLIIAIVMAIAILLLLYVTGILGAIGGDGGVFVYFVLIVIILGASFFASFYFVAKFFNQYDFSIPTYITTKEEFPVYEKILKEPYGQEIGTLKADSVIKVEKAKSKKVLTWVEGYVLVDGKPEYKTILIPEKVKIKESGDYFDFNEKSASFSAYYESIDAKNVPILEKIQNDFLAELEENGIEVKFSSDKILKESIKKSHYILPKNGYWDKGFFDLYEAKNSDDFFYIEKNHKNRFKKIVNTYYKRLEKEIIPYFEPRRK